MSYRFEELKGLFAYLDREGFAASQRLPLVASRQWWPGGEMESWRRFRRGDPNLHEVAVPAWDWAAHGKQNRSLFERLTLGRAANGWSRPDEVEVLFDRAVPNGWNLDFSSVDEASPLWTVVARFGRYILRSHPAMAGDHFVYFGDDTLFLMEQCRRLLAELQQEGTQRVRCLDLCCGGGGVGLSLPIFQGELQGLDLNPAAVALASSTARAQGLSHYNYECSDILEGLSGEYDLIFGNPPTLDPKLTGQDVFYATGSLDVLASILESCLTALSERGRAAMTVFSAVRDGRDETLDVVRKVLGERRGLTYRVRREFALREGLKLRHALLVLKPLRDTSQEVVPLAKPGWNLPGLSWRRPR